jgi:hypothetical protein
VAGTLADFVFKLRVKSETADFTFSPWSGVSKEARDKRDILHVTGSMDLLLYVVAPGSDFGIAKGVWDLSRGRILTLRSALSRWWLVLVMQAADFGYLVPSQEVFRRIETNQWPRSPQDTYRVEEGLALPREYAYKSFDDLLLRLFHSGVL